LIVCRPFASAVALIALSLPVCRPLAQQDVPAAPEQAPSAQVPSAPAPRARPVRCAVFPNRSGNFTAATPTKETVNAFCRPVGLRREPCLAGTGDLKTPVDGVSKVIIFIGDKTGKLKHPHYVLVLPTASTSSLATTSSLW